MKTIVIKRFKNDKPGIIELMKTLIKYNSTIGLKIAKDKIDSMVSKRIPIEYSVDDIKLDEFIKDLVKQNLEFEIK